jgi:hypothetical protein
MLCEEFWPSQLLLDGKAWASLLFDPQSSFGDSNAAQFCYEIVAVQCFTDSGSLVIK